MLQTEAIQKFLLANTHPDLAELYTQNHEVQVNAAQDDGVRITGEYQGRAWHGWQDPNDPTHVWKSFRIPYKAKTEPEYEPKDQKWPLGQHAEGVGMTGWNYVQRRSEWVAYDFDSIANHKQGLTGEDLAALSSTAMTIPWVTVRKSTSGRGYHLYIFLPNVPTQNHTEHAALGRAVLGMLCAKTGFDFQSKVDACGGNMWVWHRKMTGTDGLRLVKKGEVLTEIPVNWRDHLEVIKGNRRKNLPRYIEDQTVDLFEELCGTRPRIKLDETHKALIEKLEGYQNNTWWDADHWMLVTNTYDLKRAHTELKLRGIFETNATGKDGEQNCFLFAGRKGSWTVRRYTVGVQEHPSWSQDSNGYTRCFYNQEPDLEIAARTSDGIELEKGGFTFNQASTAVAVAKQLGALIELPGWADKREAILRLHKKDGRLIAEVKHENSDNGGEMSGWKVEKGFWKRIYNIKIAAPTESEVGNYDDIVRHLVTSSQEDYGWSVNTGGNWQSEPLPHIKLALKSMNINDREIAIILGNAVLRSWKIVNIPFESEFPGDRRWNRDAAQLSYKPKLEEPFEYPTWQSILDHCGSGLDESVLKNDWCRINAVKTGGEYLKMWVASLFQRPCEPLPYLFLYSQEENTGKSTLHEALAILFARGCVDASKAICSDGGFNGELQNAVLCTIEEVDLSKHREARSRIKTWITSREISVHIKGQTPFHMVNTTHWIQTANSPEFCPIVSGDTRITMSYVKPLTPNKLIPKSRLFQLLEKEASDFLGGIMSIELPLPDGRLSIPIIETQDKKTTAVNNMNSLESFIENSCFKKPGAVTKFSDFYERFINSLDQEDIMNWTKIRVGRELPRMFPKGKYTLDNGQFYIGNLSLNSDCVVENATPWIVSDNFLRR